METKLCKGKCNEWKSLDCFSRDKNRKDGRYPECKECKKERCIANTLLRKEPESKRCAGPCGEIKPIECFPISKTAGRVSRCKDCRRDYKRAYAAKNGEKIADVNRQWFKRRAQDDEYMNVRVSRYTAWSQDNREFRNTYRRDLCESKPSFRMRCRLSSALHSYLKNAATKRELIADLIGCTRDELMGHLESKFKPGMNWNNHGPIWHVDHIKPCCLFDLVDEKQRKDCFNFRNLQPLFKKDNMKKGKKYVEITAVL